MAYEVRAESAPARPLAAVRGAAARADLGPTILGLLDQVWPIVREQHVQTGHNVVIYLNGLEHIEAGVEVFSDFVDTGAVRHLATPAGLVATATHWGEYTEMAGAYAALEQWCEVNRRPRAGPSWEVYGDWADDPEQRRTDIFFLLEPAP